MGNKASSTLDHKLQDLYPLPKKYKHLKVLGQGGFGVVLKCLDKDTKDTVAIKIAKASGVEIEEEALMLRLLMENKLDQKNIVKFHDGFWRNKCMVFEVLDIDLHTYLNQRNAPMCLQDIRDVMEQMATALDALKSIGVIHTDLKTDNIMLVDHTEKPFKVKLIDFGLAILRCRAKHTKICPVPDFRAPEIIFGFPYSEAVDIWSLGCVMAFMVFGHTLFPGWFGDELLYYMCDLLGPPPDHMITASSRSQDYFIKDACNQWTPKTSEEFQENRATDKRTYIFRSLDEMKTMRLEEGNPTEAAERSQCIELLKETLRWDEKERITPQGILNHPFITKSYLNKSSQHDNCKGHEGDESPLHKPQHGVIMVQPAPPHCTTNSVEETEVELISQNITSTSMSEVCIANDILDDRDDGQQTEKKRKTCIKRFFSWMKKRVCPSHKVRVEPM